MRQKLQTQPYCTDPDPASLLAGAFGHGRDS